MAMLAWALAHWLRFDFRIAGAEWSVLSAQLPAITAIYGVAFWLLGVHHGIWRYAGMLELRRIVAAVVLGAACAALIFTMSRIGDSVPRAVYFIGPVLLTFLIGGSRLAWRA